MVRNFRIGTTCIESGNDAAQKKVETMNTLTSSLSTKQQPAQAEIDSNIAQAHKMRADYIAKSLVSGVSLLRSLFSHKSATAKMAVKSYPVNS